MRKTKLLVSALSVAAILPLSSCGLERTNAKDYEGTLEMYRAFFEKTYEYDNMKVVMDLGDGRFRTEYICASTSHSIDSGNDLDTWAFLNKDGWKTVAYEYNETKYHYFKYNAEDYGVEYKNFISYIDFLESYKDAVKANPALEEEAIFDAKKDNLGEEKTRFTLKISRHTDEGDKHWLSFVADAEHGLVRNVTYSTMDPYAGVVSRSIAMSFSYGAVKSIDIPDITGWEER